MPKASKAKKDKLAQIRRSYKAAVEADRTNRRLAMDDMKFIHEPGYQWDEYTRRERGDRPSYEFNKLRVTVKRVINDIRQNRPQGKVRAVEDGDRKVADIYEGLCRNIWNQSDGDTVIDQAAEYSVGGGMAAWRINTVYANDSAFDQEIRIEPIRNPFCVYCDPSAEDPLRRDARYWFLTTRLSHEAFEEKYGKAEKVDWDGEGEEFEDDQDWEDEESVRIVEYWYREPVTRTIVLLSDGRTVDAEEVAKVDPEGQLQVVRERTVQSYKIRNCIASGASILEEGEWAGSQFPFVMVFGDTLVLDGKNIWFGLARFAKDAQRAYNYSRTYAIEAIALAPQAKFWATPEMAQGHETEWAEAHKKNFPYLLANPDPVMGGRFPEQMPGANVPPAIINEIGVSSDDIKGVTGIYDASLGNRSNETSGIAIRSRQAQGEIAVYNYRDNIGKGVRRTWELLVDLIPRIYDTARQLRILGADGAEDYVAVNSPDPVTGQTLNDLGRGKYDVDITIGPSFAIQRQEAAEVYLGLVNSNPQIMGVAGDLLFKSLDLPLADEIAERIKVTLVPPVQQMLASGKEVPPEAQAAMAQANQAMQMVEQVGQQLQQQQQELAGEKASVEADKAEIKAQITKLQAEKQALDAHYRELVAKIENAQLKDQLARTEQEAQESENVAKASASISVQLQDALAQIQQQAAEFMQSAAMLLADLQARAKPGAKRFVAQRDAQGRLVGGIIQSESGAANQVTVERDAQGNLAGGVIQDT